jgi:general secretion pathway protein I
MIVISSPRARQGGFSLLEILVAFSILSLSLGVLLRIFAGGGHIAATADEYSRAILTAESLMAKAGVESPLQPGITEGELPGGYHWHINVHPYPFDQGLLGGEQQLGFKPFWVDLTVEWGDEQDPRAFDLKTLRLIPDKPGGGFN